MNPVVTALAVLIAIAPKSGPISMVSRALAGPNVSVSLAADAMDRLSEQLRQRGMRVMTSAELGRQLGAEKQARLISCADGDSRCLAELGRALETEAILTGSLDRSGAQLQLDLSAVASDSETSIAVYTVRAGREQELLDQLPEAARHLATQLTARLRGAPVASAPAPEPSMLVMFPRSWALVPAGAGAIVFAGGAVFTLLAGGVSAELTQSARLTLAQGNALAGQGAVLQGIGVTAMIVGGLALVGSGALWWLGGPDHPRALALGATPLPGGASLILGGAIP